MDALRHSRYRLVFAVATVTAVALWLVYTVVIASLLDAGRPVAEIGLFNACWTLGMPFAIACAGALTDRFGPIAVTVAALAGKGAGIGLMVAGIAGGTTDLPVLLAAAVAFGASEGFASVSIPVLAGAVVPRRDMGSALGALMLTNAAGRIVAGLVAGPVVAAIGGATTLLACIAFLGAGMAGLRLLGPVAVAHDPLRDGALPGASRLDPRPAVRWLRAEPAALTVVLLGGLVSLFVYSYWATQPLVIERTVGEGAGAQGIATAIGGIGVVVAALGMGPAVRRIGSGRFLVAMALGAAAFVALLGFAAGPAMTIGTLVLIALATNAHAAASGLTLQLLAPSSLRGRVLGLYGLVFTAVEPIGIAVGGALAGEAGVTAVLVGAGVLAAVATVALVAMRPSILGAGRAASVAVGEGTGAGR